MKKSFYSGMEGLNSILDKVVKNLGIDRGLKQLTLLNLWPQVIGSRFEATSKAVSIVRKNNLDILIVAVKSSVVSQELYMFKDDILRKLKPIAESLGFKIVDILFNVKIWSELDDNKIPEDKETIELYSRLPSDKEIENIEIPESIEKSVINSACSVKFETEELKNRIIKTALDDIKLQIWKKNNGFPSCVNCGISLSYRIIEGENLCPSCKYN